MQVLRSILSGENIELAFAMLAAIIALLFSVAAIDQVVDIPPAWLQVVSTNIALLVLIGLAIGLLRDRLTRTKLPKAVSDFDVRLDNMYLAGSSRLTHWSELQPTFKSQLEYASKLECLI